MAVAGNISVSAGAQLLTVLPVQATLIGDPFLLAVPVYQYANLDLPFSPNDPGLQYTLLNFDPLVHNTLAARFFNLLDEYSDPLFLFGATTVQSVNAPIIFEPPLRMCLSGLPEVWTVVSSSDPDYSGCLVSMSTDGGATFNLPQDTTGSSLIAGNATMGFVASGDWAAHVDVDTVDPLTVDLSESLGTLNSYSLTDENNFRYPSYVGPSGSFIYLVSGGLLTPSVAPTRDVYGGSPSPEGIPWPGGDLVFARIRGSGMAVWGDVNAVAVRDIWTDQCAFGSCCPTDTELLALLFPECLKAYYGISCVPATGVVPCDEVPVCAQEAFPCSVYQGAAVPGGIQTCAGGGPLFEFEALGVAVGFGFSGIITQSMPWTGAIIPSATIDGVTFPGNSFYTGGVQPYNNLIDYQGGQIFMVAFLPTTGYAPLFVAVVGGAYGGPPAPSAPGWTLLLQGKFMNVFVYSENQDIITQPTGPYELMAHQTATGISGNLFVMPAASGAGGPLRRAVFSMPIPGQGIDHPVGSQYAWLDDRLLNRPPGILKIPLDAAWIGRDLQFRFQAFNALKGLQDISTTAPYSYTPTGLAYGQFSPQPTYVQSPLQALSQSDANTIQMPVVTESFAGNQIRYNARTFTIPTPPSIGQTYYVTIYDPYRLGDTGQDPTQQAYIDTDQTRVLTTGYIYIGSIVAVPSDFVSAVVTPGGWPPGQVLLVNGQ